MEQQLERMLYRAAMEIESVKAAAKAQMEIHDAREKELQAQLKEARRETEQLKQQIFLLKQGCNMPSFLSQNSADQKKNYGECDPFAEEDSLSMPLSLESGGSSMDCARNSSLDSGGSKVEQSSFCWGLDTEILPQKGRLLQAVIEAGPLLQNLLMTGPLPNWRHPPPCLNHFDIPPVSVGASSSQPFYLLT